MKREIGLAYCGLACCACGQNATCVGCRNEGCTGKEWCKNFKCTREKGLTGCWECKDFPCEGGMLDKVRIRAFARFIKENGEEALMDLLERNEKNGMAYHYEGQLIGDYEAATEEEVIKHLVEGK